MNMELLDALRGFLQCFGIHVTVICSKEQDIRNFDMGIRESLLEDDRSRLWLEWIYSHGEEGVIYFITDVFGTEYCLFRIPESEIKHGDFWLIGPYLRHAVSEAFFSEMVSENQMPGEVITELREYCNAVPIVQSHVPWTQYLYFLFQRLQHDGRELRIEYKDDLSRPDEVFLKKNDDAKSVSVKMIEERYRLEDELLNAISQGNMAKALEMHSKMIAYRIAPRYKDPSRNVKNLMITVNTLFRKAAQIGGVHPVWADEMSARFAKRIEMMTDSDTESNLYREMVKKYCILVQNYSMKGYSPLIQKVVNYIDLNISEDLSVKQLAEIHMISTGYLSSLFKKETGSTVISYVNHQRVKQAIFLLNSTDRLIQDIGEAVGIPDVNYFSRVFKKNTGRTPGEYRKQISKETRI